MARAAEAAVSPIIGKKRGSGEVGKLLRRRSVGRSVGTTHERTDRASERVSDWTDLSTFGKARRESYNDGSAVLVGGCVGATRSWTAATKGASVTKRASECVG